MKRGCPRHPQDLMLVLLEYFLGFRGIPKLELLSILPHHIILLSLHMKTSFIQNFTQFFISSISTIKINKSNWV
jgi:hypothetical protein